MATPRGLGRGLGSLIPNRLQSPAASVTSAPLEPFVTPQQQEKTLGASPAPVAGIPLIVPIDAVVPNPHQPREHFAHTDLDDLIASIKTHGILQPLVVTTKGGGQYELIAGERRLRAARMAGLTGVPVIIREADQQDKLELALIENIQRQDLNAIEEAKAFKTLMDQYRLTQEEISIRVGKSRPQITNTIRLLELPEEVQTSVMNGSLTPSAARTLLAFETADDQLTWWRKMQTEKMTVRDVEEAARRTPGSRTMRMTDPNIEADEAALRGVLGTKVAVRKRGDSGKIEVSFFSDEEYRTLLQRLTRLVV